MRDHKTGIAVGAISGCGVQGFQGANKNARVMEGALYIILDSRSLFRQGGGSGIRANARDDLLVSGECVLNSVVQFARLYNLTASQKKKLVMYVCDLEGENLLFSGFISDITRELQFESFPRMLGEMAGRIRLGEMKMSPTVSRCLCKINSARRRFGSASSDNDRIVLVDASGKDDYISQYVSLLNCGFASQKLVSFTAPFSFDSLTVTPKPGYRD